MIWHDLFMVLIGFAGGGAAALINNMFTRGTQKADAAKALTTATVEFTDAVTELNKNLHAELTLLKKAVSTLTDCVDEILLRVEMPEEMRMKLIQANTSAKLAL